MTTKPKPYLLCNGRPVDTSISELEDIVKWTHQALLELIGHWSKPPDNPSSMPAIQWHFYPRNVGSDIRMLKAGRKTQVIWKTTITRVTDQSLQEKIKWANRLINKNQITLDRWKRGKSRENESILYISLVEHSRIYYKSSKVRCEKCSKFIDPNTVESHQQDIRCINQHQWKTVTDRKWIRSERGMINNCIKAGSIPGAAIPVKYHYYIPKWVLEAAKMYGSGKKYAGMSFADFVTRMAPKGEE